MIDGSDCLLVEEPYALMGATLGLIHLCVSPLNSPCEMRWQHNGIHMVYHWTWIFIMLFHKLTLEHAENFLISLWFMFCVFELYQRGGGCAKNKNNCTVSSVAAETRLAHHHQLPSTVFSEHCWIYLNKNSISQIPYALYFS